MTVTAVGTSGARVTRSVSFRTFAPRSTFRAQTFTIGSPLAMVASAAGHHINVYRDGNLFAHWLISTGRLGHSRGHCS